MLGMVLWTVGVDFNVIAAEWHAGQSNLNWLIVLILGIHRLVHGVVYRVVCRGVVCVAG